MGKRRRGREYALQLLFQLDLSGGNPEDLFEDFWDGLNPSTEVLEYAESLVKGTWSQVEFLDTEISGAAQHWRIERMAAVDRNVLRLASWELIFELDTPPAVVLDEAIEVAKKYGSEDSGSFINGILDTIRKRAEKGDLPGKQE